MDAIDAAGKILTGMSRPWTHRPHGGTDDGKPQPSPRETSPALQAAISEVLRAELYATYAGGEGQEENFRGLAAKVTAAALAVPVHGMS